MRFSDRLERVDTLRILLSHLHNLSERALSDDLQQVEGFNCQRRDTRTESNLDVHGARAHGERIPLVGYVL